MEDLTKTLLQLVTEWKKCAMANQKRRCDEIIVTLRMMGYSWPRGSDFGNLWSNFVTLNYNTMQEQIQSAVLALQSKEEQWFAEQWKNYKKGGGWDNLLPEKIDYTFALDDVYNVEKRAKEAVDCFGQPLL